METPPRPQFPRLPLLGGLTSQKPTSRNRHGSEFTDQPRCANGKRAAAHQRLETRGLSTGAGRTAQQRGVQALSAGAGAPQQRPA